MEIRTALPTDLPAIAQLEALCFPPAEAAGETALKARLAAFPDSFWLLFDGETLVAMVNGMATHSPDLTDAMYADAALHDPQGSWQMIFGVDTHPDYRRRGCAGRLLERAIADTKARGKRGLVLTCKEHLVHYYAKFGFLSEGVSASEHGGAVWYQMRRRV